MIRREGLPEVINFQLQWWALPLCPFLLLAPMQGRLSAVFWLVRPLQPSPPFPASAHISVAYSTNYLGLWSLYRVWEQARMQQPAPFESLRAKRVVANVSDRDPGKWKVLER